MSKIIEVSGLQKSFGELRAVQGVDFYVEEGSLFAFLGPNGAGKSTTIDMLTTQLKPDAGEATISGYKLGREDDGIRSSIGIVFQDSLLDPLLTVKENLFVRGSFYNLSRSELKAAVARAAATADVGDFLNRPYGKLSGGQRRRADIARALIHTPKVLFLDEPTTGLDPQTRKNVWTTIRQLQKEQGMTIFLTTHYMEEAAQADYIIIMDHGKVLAGGTPYELKERYATDLLKLMPHNAEELQAYLQSKALDYMIVSGVYHIPLKQTAHALPIVEGCGANIAGIEIVSGTMDDVFLNLTGTEVRS
ncbi:ATP-binding cassette domain-containing protein [Paenibacillus nanensis]|uniref:ATP-binding cassette domain-containing protein n=1 Tax=Paenibacillus nanensis TaxID=393251 RepID=A0A3A1UMP7_9BACL|nr:ATP-binding cassette domain-containing protein [Paenibacillus nanensis]RIX48719.1 ATP-binding cassette domain-containing protein [Paenibacillus nanensis]